MPRSELEKKVRELSFLREFAQLATTARTWDELMRTLVDRTTEALGVEVCSFYLMDRDENGLTLAATNGLDAGGVGRVRMAVGDGLTGLAAAEARLIVSRDVRVDPRFKWIPGFDQSRFTSMMAVPLPWNDHIVGVLDIQSVETREFSVEEREFMVTAAALLAGIVEKGRLQAEQEAQLETLTALDAARAELLSAVTHELRTPLAVLRAYLDLLADAAATGGPRTAAPEPATVEGWRDSAVEQVGRLDRLVDGILASVQGDGLTALARLPFDVGGAVGGTIEELTPLLRSHPLRWAGTPEPLVGLGDEGRFRQVLEHLLENEAKYAPPGGGVSVGAWRSGAEIQVYVTDDGPGVPREEWDLVFDAYVRVGRRLRGSGIGLYAARRLMDAMGGRVWLEGNGYGGSRFMVAVPAATGEPNR